MEFVLQTIRFLWPLSFAVAFVHAVGLGLPAYLLLRWRRLTAWWTGLAGGFLAGALPYAVLAFPWGAPPANLVAAHIVAGFTWTHYAGAIAGLGAPRHGRRDRRLAHLVLAGAEIRTSAGRALTGAGSGARIARQQCARNH